MDKVVKLKKDASRSDVKNVFTELGFGFFEPKSKTVEPRVKRVKAKKEVVEKPVKKQSKEKTSKKEKVESSSDN